MNPNITAIILVIVAFGAGFAAARWWPTAPSPVEKDEAVTLQLTTQNQTAREIFQTATERRLASTQEAESEPLLPLWRSANDVSRGPMGMPRPIVFQADPGDIVTNQRLSLDVYSTTDAQVEIFEASDVASGKRIRGRILPSTRGGDALVGSLTLEVRGDRVTGSITTNKGRLQIAGSRQRASLIDPNFMMGPEGPMGRQMGGAVFGSMNNMPYGGGPGAMRSPGAAQMGRTP